jgi:hypothetical protein
MKISDLSPLLATKHKKSSCRADHGGFALEPVIAIQDLIAIPFSIPDGCVGTVKFLNNIPLYIVDLIFQGKLSVSGIHRENTKTR